MLEDHISYLLGQGEKNTCLRGVIGNIAPSSWNEGRHVDMLFYYVLFLNMCAGHNMVFLDQL
jgi:hypothetical protein